MTVAEQLGRNLRRARRRSLMTQALLARRTGLHATEIGLLERGRRVPRLDTFIRLLQVTEADPEDLVVGITWHEPTGWDAPGRFTVVGFAKPAEVRAGSEIAEGRQWT